MITFDPEVNVRLLKSQENTAEALCHTSDGVVDKNNWVNIFTIVNVYMLLQELSALDFGL